MRIENLTLEELRKAYADLLCSYTNLCKENQRLQERINSASCENMQPSLFPFSISEPELPKYESMKKLPFDSESGRFDYFLSLFHGRDEFYARRYVMKTTGKAGYSPVCGNRFRVGLCDRKKYQCLKCPNKAFQKIDQAALIKHFIGADPTGSDVIGIYPLMEDNTTWFIVIDFDDQKWMDDCSFFREVCHENRVPIEIERSRSGNGAHGWLFFEQPVPAIEARKGMNYLLSQAMEKKHNMKFSSFDRLIPNQDYISPGGMGNLIALPLQGLARKNGNSEFVDENYRSYPDQWEHLQQIKRMDLVHLKSILKKAGENDGADTVAIFSNFEQQKPWEKKSPPKPLLPSDIPPEAKIVLADMIYVPIEGFSQKALNRIRRLGVFSNKEFFERQKLHLATYNTPRFLDTTEEEHGYLKIPRGCLDRLTDLFTEANVPLLIDDQRNPGRPIPVTFMGELQECQQAALQKIMEFDYGVLSAATGFGKTVIATKLIAEKGINTLIIVSKTSLIHEWEKAFTNFLTFHGSLPEAPPKRGRKSKISFFGKYGGEIKNLTGFIDIATVQSLVSDNEVKDFIKDYGMVIADECHHVASITFEQVMRKVNAKFVYGLTATPERRDGHQPILYLQCGPIRYEVDAKEAAERLNLSQYVIPRFTFFKPPVGMDGSELGMADLYNELAGDPVRNQMIISDIREAVLNGKTPIVLAKRISQIKIIAQALSSDIPNVILLSGEGTAAEKRRKFDKIQAIPSGEPVVIAATGDYVGEGFDYPRLDTLFIAAPVSWKGVVTQYAGRLHRAFPGKKAVTIFDYIDINIKILESMYQKRMITYKRLGYQIITGTKETEKMDILLDCNSYLPHFEQNILAAAKEIVIVSPLLQKKAVERIFEKLLIAQTNGARVVIVTLPVLYHSTSHQETVSLLIEKLSTAGFVIIQKESLFLKAAIIDRRIVWLGTINYLSLAKENEYCIHFPDENVATELLNTI